jgi:UDP-GlcNAc:undecaprenyl-phosphate GlcNAc-1-phosphate transferase
VGGIAMFLAFGLGVLLLEISLQPYRVLLVGSCILVFTGVLDDFRELTPRFRLAIQIFCGLLMVFWGKVSLADLGYLLPFFDLHVNYVIGLVISVCAVIGIINAVNMLDGVDGLVGSISFVQLAMLIYLAISAHLYSDAALLVILVASILGYLRYNLPLPWRQHAIVFMGDAGSMFLGFVLVWFMVYLSQSPHYAASPTVFLWITAVPLFDIGALLIRRPLNKRSPFRAGRDHIHHLLQAYGFSKLGIVCTLSSASLIFGILGIIASRHQITEHWLFLAFLAAFVLYVILAEMLWRKVQKKFN